MKQEAIAAKERFDWDTFVEAVSNDVSEELGLVLLGSKPSKNDFTDSVDLTHNILTIFPQNHEEGDVLDDNLQLLAKVLYDTFGFGLSVKIAGPGRHADKMWLGD